MKENKFPYSPWPGLIVLVVIVSSGLLMLGIVEERAKATAKPKAEQTVEERLKEPSMRDWQRKIRDSRARS